MMSKINQQSAFALRQSPQALALCTVIDVFTTCLRDCSGPVNDVQHNEDYECVCGSIITLSVEYVGLFKYLPAVEGNSVIMF